MEGDRYTRYFHRSVVIAQIASRILSIRDGVGNVLEDIAEIREHISNFFVKLYGTEKEVSFREVRNHPVLIDLQGPITNEEVGGALFGMHPQ